MREKDLNEAVALKGQLDFLANTHQTLTTVSFDLVTPGVGVDGPMDLLADTLQMDNDNFREVARAALLSEVNRLIQERRQMLKALGVTLEGEKRVKK